MGIPGSANLLMLGGGAQAYEIEQSLRFDGSSTYLERTPSTNGNRNKATLSFWLKLSKDAPMAVYRQANRSNFRIHVSGVEGRVVTNTSISSGSNNFQEHTELRRDYSAWYHVLHVIDTTQSTSTNRVRTWFNNVEDNNASWSFPSQNFTTDYNSTEVVRIGYDDGELLGGYLAEFHWLDGQVIWDPGQFGEYDDNGVWRPIEYTGGNYGTNGFYLKFDPSATNGIGHDHSGNGNNFTPTGFSTSGTGTDVMSDTPTTNYPTLNPLNPAVTQLSNGNLDYSGSSYQYVRSTQVMSGDKYYFEVTTSEANINVGIMDVATAPSTITTLGSPVGYGIKSRPSGPAYTLKTQLSSATDTSISPQMTANDVLGFSVDLVNGTLSVSRNGSGTDWGTLFTGIDTTKSFYVYAGHESAVSSTAFQINFGQRAFAYTPPTGYKALNTANLPEPTIKDGSSYFDTVTYSGATSGTAGAGTTQTVTGLGFSPDLVWIKNRSNANSHGLFDQVRGAVNALRSDLQNVEATTNSSGALSAFNSNGFTLANGSSGSDQAILTHQSGYTYVAWAWDAGGAGSSNTAGSITSTVSANPAAGFSIVTWTGNGTAGATIGHGLGVKPSFFVVKCRNLTGCNWDVYHSAYGATKHTILNGTNSVTTYSGFFNNTEPTSTLITLGSDREVNQSSATYVAYCFAEVEGYSRFGSYNGNGSSNGPFVYCGFKPRFVMYKRTGGADNWFMYDTARDNINVSYKALRADETTVEKTVSTDIPIDILSNGFKIRFSGTAGNGSGETIIYAAFAEHPFGGSGISPATAR